MDYACSHSRTLCRGRGFNSHRLHHRCSEWCPPCLRGEQLHLLSPESWILPLAHTPSGVYPDNLRDDGLSALRAEYWQDFANIPGYHPRDETIARVGPGWRFGSWRLPTPCQTRTG